MNTKQIDVENKISLVPSEINSKIEVASITAKVWAASESTFWIISGIFDPLVGFFTQGLSDFLVLETLRHGTSWQNYISIRKEGVNPAFGGGDKGSCAGIDLAGSYVGNFVKEFRELELRKKSQGCFFAFADSHLGKETKYFDADGEEKVKTFTPKERFFLPLYVRWEPHACSFMAGVSQVVSKNEKENDTLTSNICQIANGFVNMAAPALKIRMRKEDVDQIFETDPLLPGRALRTKSKIGTEYIGLTSIFKQANDGCILQRIKSNPKKSFIGLIRLINPIGIGLLLAFGIYSYTHKAKPISQPVS